MLRVAEAVACGVSEVGTRVAFGQAAAGSCCFRRGDATAERRLEEALDEGVSLQQRCEGIVQARVHGHAHEKS